MKQPWITKRSLALLAVMTPLFLLLVYTVVRSGPLAPVSVVLTTVENRPLSPTLYGIGQVEARYTYKIGPIVTGRVDQVRHEVGDLVKPGQVLARMASVGLDERIQALDAAVKQARAQLDEAQTRRDHARTEDIRYTDLLAVRATSQENAAAKRNDLMVAEAELAAAREGYHYARAEQAALVAQRDDLILKAPRHGLVASRDAEPGDTVSAGQPVLTLIDPNSLWVHVRFDQIRAHGLAADLPAQIKLRSQPDQWHPGRVLRVEPLADTVTEEILAKVIFDHAPHPLPPVGELVEITVDLPALPEGPVIPNAAIKRNDGRTGVWQVIDDDLVFTPVSPVVSDLDGQVLIRDGLKAGDKIVVYSEKTLNRHSRIERVHQLPGVAS